MSRKTQRYSKEFKAEAVRTVLENQLSISEGASRLSLPEGTLGQWVTAARKGLGTPGSRTVAELESEILQLRKALNEGNCYDNAPMESFWGTLKNESLSHYRFNNRDEAISVIREYIEIFYNRQRRHSRLGNISPAAFREKYHQMAA
ncbi:transposase [Escherichia coli]|nr:IS3 family transposase [Escherichia coli]EFB9664979.1 IS3 family transposase [Escherichia coli]EFM9901414.1 transposase [Escherichia coli]EGN4481186.1 transposase [Escherichia coli]EHK8933765.1 transposase [Escherichia coli]